MLISFYKPGNSLVHRTPAGWKIVLLFVFCTALFLVQNWWFLGVAIALVLTSYLLAKLPLSLTWQAVRPALWVLVLIFLVQLWLNDWQFGLYVVLRFAIMIVAATLLTLTSKTSEMIEGIERSVGKLFGADIAEKVGLAFSLSLRFIPMVRETYQEVREAQKARGLGRNWRALITPTMIRTLKSADDIAQAIDARSAGAPLGEKAPRHD
ncbi:biotin transport system permease protein [Maritalea mobilis]|uniref:Biotin transport system permease protein n=1 Tax=Maritalea mobilis TaxID=483324 RepID=A0A4R6VK64_9HYPH|nr:energy-coupling factor transporter transmembrane protein EcfT [Maritalea mobilis]TDQ62026.1 biotin transport system permease protein [Maritalea mobilis]